MKKTKVVRFLQPRHLPSMIWDPKNDCPLVEFKNFSFTTDNPEIIKKLKDMGYSIEGVDPVPSHIHEVGKPPITPVIEDDKGPTVRKPDFERERLPQSEAEAMAMRPTPRFKDRSEGQSKLKIRRKVI